MSLIAMNQEQFNNQYALRQEDPPKHLLALRRIIMLQSLTIM